MSTDWQTIKEEYLSSRQLTLRDLAQKHSLAYQTLRAQSSKHGWYREKQEKNRQCAQAAEQAVQLPAQATGFTFEQSCKINEIADRLLENIRQSSEYSDKPTGISQLVTALKNLTSVLRDVNDIPSIKEERSYELTKKRLELAQSRLAQAETAPGESGVVLLPEVAGEQAGEQGSQ